MDQLATEQKCLQMLRELFTDDVLMADLIRLVYIVADGRDH